MTNSSPSGVITKTLADEWVRGTTPLAVALVNWAAPVVNNNIRVRAVAVDDLRQAPYGPLMLSWFDSHRTEPIIYYLTQHTTYLLLSAKCLDQTIGEPDVVRSALTDGSRMRIAITNDVLQVMAPTPPGPYSMIRHHALMFLAATLWLPAEQCDRWLYIYDRSLEAVRRDLGPTAEIGTLLSDIERNAFTVFDSGREMRIDSKPPFELEMATSDQDTICRYILYCNAAVGLLVKRLREAQRWGWTEQAWLAAELNPYRSDYYLLSEFGSLQHTALVESGRSPVINTNEGATNA